VEAKAGVEALTQLWALRLKYAEPAPAMQPLLEQVQQQQFTHEQLLALGRTLLDSYRYTEAVALLQAGCEAMPTAHVLHHLHGVALEQAGQPAAAVAAYELALATAQKALATAEKTPAPVSAAAQRAAALSEKLWQIPKIPE
jgi:Flp pilus assembly protein TadD